MTNGENEQKEDWSQTVSLIRLRRNITSLVKPDFIEMRVDPGNITVIRLTLDLSSVVESIWVGAKLDFTVTVGDNYPFSIPIVYCNTPVLHPNIDTDGLVGIELITIGDKPVFKLSTIVTGIANLMIEPNLKKITNAVVGWKYQVHHSHFLEEVKKMIGEQRQTRDNSRYKK